MKSEFHFSDKNFDKINDWSFNILQITDENEKFDNIFYMFNSLNYIEKLEINISVFNNLLVILREKYNYRNNPFHNFDHAFTGCFFFFKIKK